MPLRIAQVSPLFESVPPQLYGGTERVVSYLTEELVRQEHEITLFASGDSTTRARLVPSVPKALRLAHCIDPCAYQVLQLEQIRAHASEFDLIHFHTDYLHFPLSRRSSIPTVTTLHGRLDLPDLQPLYREFHDMPVVSISDAQRRPVHWINWQGTVYHGLPHDLYRPRSSHGDYLAFLGRISPEKRVDYAIEIAREYGMPLRIAAKVDAVDRDYFDRIIRPLLRTPGVEFIGEIGEQDKQEFLGGAFALLFPIDWPEPFGLVMIESMACGTPVIAFRRGSVSEVIEDGVTGFAVNGIEQAVRALHEVEAMSRTRVRAEFEARFSVSRMAQEYVRIYSNLIETHAERTSVRRS